MTKRTFKTIERNGKKFNILALPNTNFFKFEIINMYGSHIERIYKARTGKDVYGISHFIEHLGFRETKDYTTSELMKLLKNEGNYNASTDYDRINYWFQTTMHNTRLAIKLVCNIALNDLTKIPEDQFEIEKKVVFNEAKRYADDDQTMFYFNIVKSLCEYEEDDNVIGIPETIDGFTLEDAIAVKDIFLQTTNNVYNLTFDPTVLTEDEVLDMVESELSRFKPLCKTPAVSQAEYDSVVVQPKKIKTTIVNDSEQFMTNLNFDINDVNPITAIYGNDYIGTYAEDVSLSDIIREQNGLTYGISFYSDIVSYKNYVSFSCDVTKGTEDLLMQLFDESINKVADIWSDDAHKNFIDANNLKRTMSLLDQKNYSSWHRIAAWHPEVIEAIKDVIAVDLDWGYAAMESKFATKEAIGAYLEKIRELVNTKDYGIVTN